MFEEQVGIRTPDGTELSFYRSPERLALHHPSQEGEAFSRAAAVHDLFRAFRVFRAFRGLI